MKKIAFALAALIASPALAMGTPPDTTAPSREATGEYEALRTLNSAAVNAIQPQRSTAAERAAALPAYNKLQASIAAAYNATTAKPFSQATFDRHAADVRKYHAEVCSHLSGC